MIDLAVLPGAEDVQRCADFTRSLAVDPGGTAIHADVIIAVEIPLPWPKPVFQHELLVTVPDLLDAAPRLTRVLASVPRTNDSYSIVRYELTPNGTERQEWVALSAEDAAGDLRSVILGADPENSVQVTDSPETEVWICTQGSHDLCCGSDGMRLANDVSGMWPDVVIRRVSHTGGHRFAPTALTMPSGRMWAYLDPEGLGQILGRSGDASVLAERCRGWWGAQPGAAQVAERALLGTVGWDVDDYFRRVEAIPGDEGDDSVQSFRVDLGVEGPSYCATVRVNREVPTIACRAPGGLPYKTGIEYELVALDND